jgi:hypothetical protein
LALRVVLEVLEHNSDDEQALGKHILVDGLEPSHHQDAMVCAVHLPQVRMVLPACEMVRSADDRPDVNQDV